MFPPFLVVRLPMWFEGGRGGMGRPDSHLVAKCTIGHVQGVGHVRKHYMCSHAGHVLHM